VKSVSPINKPPCLFSVVIPTRGRSKLVERLLASLRRAIKYSDVTAEVVIVDDSSSAERDRIENLCHQYGARFAPGSASVRGKRNRGIEESRGEIILFTDSDCEVSPNIFNEHLKLYTEADTAAVLGVTEFTGKKNITWDIVSRTTFLDPFFFAKTFDKIVDSAPYVTCTNLSIKKEILKNVGMFDVDFPFRLGGDDTELGVRINEAGYKIKMNPDAIVYHTRETWDNVLKVASRAFRWGRTDFHILKKHPRLGHVGFPSLFTVLLLLVVASLAAVLSGHWDIAIIAIVGLMVFTLLVESIIKGIKSGETPYSIPLRLVARLLDLVFEAGTIFESLRRGSLMMLYKRIIYIPGQLAIEWESEVVRSWSIIVGLLLTTVAVWILKGS